MTKSNKILCIVGAILIAFLGLFGIVFASQNDIVVKADTSSGNAYSFTTSNIIYPLSLFTRSGDATSSTNGIAFVSISFVFGLGSSYNFDSRGDYFMMYFKGAYADYSPVYMGEFTAETWNGIYMSYNNQYVLLNFYRQSAFDYNVNHVVIGTDSSYASGQANLGATSIYYYSTNGSYLRMQFCLRNDTSYFNAYKFSSRTYYFIAPEDLDDNQYYQAGYTNGYDVGNSAGYDTGYGAGYSVGNTAGYNSGYNAGIENANDYTFLGLIGATIDAPISAFTSFFDFELLGVNLKDFFFAILTFALVIVIIRFALAR